jgi:hypothetical protein
MKQGRSTFLAIASVAPKDRIAKHLELIFLMECMKTPVNLADLASGSKPGRSGEAPWL